MKYGQFYRVQPREMVRKIRVKKDIARLMARLRMDGGCDLIEKIIVKKVLTKPDSDALYENK